MRKIRVGLCIAFLFSILLIFTHSKALAASGGNPGCWEIWPAFNGNAGDITGMEPDVTDSPTPTPTVEVTQPPTPTPVPTPPNVTWPPRPTPIPTRSPSPPPIMIITPSPTPAATKEPIIIYIATPQFKYVKRLTGTSVKVKWNKVPNATGYELYMSTKPNSGFKKIKTTKSTNYVKKKLGKNRKYYFKVRAYNKKEGKWNGAFSETATVEILSIQKIKNRIVKLKKRFPNGKYWNHWKSTSGSKDNSNYVSNRPCFHYGMTVSSTCNRYYCKASNTIGYQCWGYVDKICDIVFGVNSKIRSHKSFAKVKIGDHIRYQGHSVLVIDKGSDFVKVTEVNYGNTCQIRWGRKVTKNELYGAVYYTRY